MIGKGQADAADAEQEEPGPGGTAVAPMVGRTEAADAADAESEEPASGPGGTAVDTVDANLAERKAATDAAEAE